MTDETLAPGKVYLVGAGPGDPDLLTVQARRIVESADAVFYDALVGEGIVDLVPPATEAIDVGKRPSDDGPRTTQRDINRMMVDRASAGDVVARLKGGDPTVYGRGGEEAEHLAAAGVPLEIVPGVTSAVAAPAVVGIPLTHREHASTVTVITGHETPSKDDSALDRRAIARTVRTGGTLVVLMGVRTLSRTVGWLQREGVDPDTPAAIIERATWSDEQVAVGTLDTIVDRAETADIAAPAITVVGDVVTVRDRLTTALDRGSSAGDTDIAAARWFERTTGAPSGISIPHQP